MSGPITAGYLLFHGALFLAQRAIVEAKAMKREYGDVIAQLRAREDEIAHAKSAQQAARLERIAAMRRDAERARTRHERLRTLVQSLAAHAPAGEQPMVWETAPPLPASDDDAAWSAYAAALDASVRELESMLARAGGEFGAQARAALQSSKGAPTIDDVLSAYVLQRRMKPGLDPAQTDRYRSTVARVLQRLVRDGGEPFPAALESLAHAIIVSPSSETADALTSELRLAVQRHNEMREARARDADTARRMLAELPDDVPPALRSAIERVAAGVVPMDAALRESAQATIDAAIADREALEQRAAADVLEQSLRDLGYDVEDIEATLFVDGGAVHFRRDGWEDYFVRLRIDPRERTVNFNVVRAGAADATPERRRLDALAEDRWCAEFPRLVQTLAARGLALNVTRRLGAGALPVQQVEASTLPRIRASEDDGRPRQAPRARPIT